MSDFNIHILGCGSSLPTVQHLPTSQVLELRGKLYMIDCGEGAQRQMRLQRLSFGKLVAIFISHLHGDHCFGLPGLLSSLAMLGRTGRLDIIGPKGLKAFLQPILSQFCHPLSYEVVIQEIDDRAHALIWEDRSLTVHSLPLSHRMPTSGYLFREKVAERHIVRSATDFWSVPLAFYPSLLQGEDFVREDGEIVPNHKLTRMGQSPRSYAYCSDTSFVEANIDRVRGVTLLYHEATFLETAKERARETGHSTALQAGTFARLSEVGQLVIGHYSARYKTSSELLQEARLAFPNTIAAKEGLVINL